MLKKLPELINQTYDEWQMLENVCLLFSDELSCYAVIADKDGKTLFECGTEHVADGGYELFQKFMCGVSFIGSLTVKRKSPFDDYEEQAFYAFASIASLIVRFLVTRDKENTERTKAAIGSLSYSELTAALYVFEELGGKSGHFISSNISKEKGITKSVIVNCLKKLESAGFIEVRSLGVKGTHVRVLNDALVFELGKLKR